jgi:hypothetical protein
MPLLVGVSMVKDSTAVKGPLLAVAVAADHLQSVRPLLAITAVMVATELCQQFQARLSLTLAVEEAERLTLLRLVWLVLVVLALVEILVSLEATQLATAAVVAVQVRLLLVLASRAL